MSDLNKDRYTLQVNAKEVGVNLTVLDAQGLQQADSGQGHLNLDLPRGLYTVRAEQNGLIKDTPVRLTQNSTIEARLPARYSAIPLPGAKTTHEYYSYNAWDFSHNYTAANLEFNGSANSAFMLFVRAPERGKGVQFRQTGNMSLKTLEGQTLSDLEAPDIRFDQTDGYTAFSAATSPGSIILDDQGQVPRQTLFPLLPNFQTQVYIMHLGRPLYEDMRVLTVPNADITTRGHRDPYTADEFADVANQVDVGMGALQNNVEDIGESLVNNFLASKFRNPILGLLGAYLVLLRRHRRTDREFDASLPNIIIDNLSSLIPDSPDVAALKYLAAPWLGEPQVSGLKNPPLFRAGAEVLIKAAARHPALIAPGCLFDVISDRLLTDTAWTTWNPVQLPLGDYMLASAAEEDTSLSWVELALADSLAVDKEEWDVADLAERIGVTQRSVSEAYTALKARVNDRPEQIENEGLDVSMIRNFSYDEGRYKMLKVAGTALGRLLVKKAREKDITFQSIYPTIKNVLSEYSDSDQSIRASDDIKDLVDNKKIDSMRDKLFRKIQRKFPEATLENLEEGFSKVKTVRDLAHMVVKRDKD